MEELIKPEYQIRGSGNRDDSILCWDCKIRILVEDACEKSDGKFVCDDCYKSSLEFNE
jgi:hypothetical protein